MFTQLKNNGFYYKDEYNIYENEKGVRVLHNIKTNTVAFEIASEELTKDEISFIKELLDENEDVKKERGIIK